MPGSVLRPRMVAHVIIAGSLGGSSSAGPILQTWNLGMEATNLPKVTQLESSETGPPARQPGFPADILNYTLEEKPSGNLNWTFLIHLTIKQQQAVEGRALVKPQFQRDGPQEEEPARTQAASFLCSPRPRVWWA